MQRSEITMQIGSIELTGNLTLPEQAEGLVLFAHGSGSSRFSRRNQFVAEVLNRQGLATLLFDLLTENEQVIDEQTRHLRFDIDLLAHRLTGAADWIKSQPKLVDLRLGLFGASTGAAAALATAAARPALIQAVVSRGGRPDLAGEALPHVKAPTLLIVGAADPQVLQLNRNASLSLRAEHRIEIIPGASHLFEEPGTLEQAAQAAADWFRHNLVERFHARTES